MDYLEPKEGKRVLELLTQLFLYAYESIHQKARVTKRTMQKLYLTGSQILFKDEESSKKLIEDYIAAHPELESDDVEIMRQWKGCYKRSLYVMMYDREYTFVMDCTERSIYGVKGLTVPLLASLSKQTFPCKVEYTILPYHHEYIVDAIGVSEPISELATIINLCEEFRSIAKEKGAKVTDQKTIQFKTSPRDETASYETIISDYLKPLDYVIRTLGNSFKKEGIELALAAWNASYEDEAKVASRYDEDVYTTMIHPLMEYRKTCFGNLNFKVKGLRPSQDSSGRNYMKVEVE